MSGAFGHKRPDRRDKELECLRRLVRELESEARGRRQRRDQGELVEGSVGVGSGHGEASCQSSSHRHWERSQEYVDRDLISRKGDGIEMLPWML